jgi:methylase of polypeptide subunit release factors
VAVVGCGRGGLVIALAVARPDDVIAGFDTDPTAIAFARRWAARRGVADRVTFEVAAPGRLLGDGYDLVYLLPGAGPAGRWASGFEGRGL